MIQPVKTGKNVRRRSAFTLMELMIVVAIIVVLAGLGGIAFFGQLEKAKMSSAHIQCTVLENAVTTYLANEDKMPDNLGELQNCTPPLLKEGALTDPWGGTYQLRLEDNGGYCVFTSHGNEEINSKKKVKNQ